MFSIELMMGSRCPSNFVRPNANIIGLVRNIRLKWHLRWNLLSHLSLFRFKLGTVLRHTVLFIALVNLVYLFLLLLSRCRLDRVDRADISAAVIAIILDAR